jgi:hypothetical protein
MIIGSPFAVKENYKVLTLTYNIQLEPIMEYEPPFDHHQNRHWLNKLKDGL